MFTYYVKSFDTITFFTILVAHYRFICILKLYVQYDNPLVSRKLAFDLGNGIFYFVNKANIQISFWIKQMYFQIQKQNLRQVTVLYCDSSHMCLLIHSIKLLVLFESRHRRFIIKIKNRTQNMTLYPYSISGFLKHVFFVKNHHSYNRCWHLFCKNNFIHLTCFGKRLVYTLGRSFSYVETRKQSLIEKKGRGIRGIV